MPPFHRLLQLVAAALAAALSAAGASPPPAPSGASCLTKCGGVDIPYPFGIGPDPSCAMPGFNLSCIDTGRGVLKPFSTNVEILSISLPRAQVRMRNRISAACFNTTSRRMVYDDWTLNFTGTPYRFSDAANKFTVIGCNTLAYISDNDDGDAGGGGKYMSGCVAMCRRGDVTTLANGSCSGIGCCQTAIPRGMQYYGVRFDEGFDTSRIYNVSPCSYAVLMDSSDFAFLPSYATSPEFNTTHEGRAPLVMDWAVGNESCKAAREKPESYACVSSNSDCLDSVNGQGYICNCSTGFDGNPYLPNGCRDIDECLDRNKYPCYGICRNKPGRYECVCPPGTRGNATIGSCVTDRLTKGVRRAIGIVASVSFVLFLFLGIEVIRNKRRIAKQELIAKRDAYFQQHGGQLLIDMMKVESSGSFKLYAREQIELATSNFDTKGVIGEGGQGTVYIGINLDPDNNPVAIKKCKGLDENRKAEEFGKELLILSRVRHENIVKLLGCSLQFEAPVLVYEFVPNKTLHHLIHAQGDPSIRTLDIRMKIAADSAEALAYLHTLNHPIFHGDVKSANILLGHDLSAKVSDFGCSMIRSTDENLQVVKGTMGYLDPEYLLNFELTDKSDVYSFGVVVLELITRRKALSKEKESLVSVFKAAVKDGKLCELVDTEIITNQDSMEFVSQVAQLAGQCLVTTGDHRPTMRQVANELRQLSDAAQQRTGGLHDGASPLVVQGRSFTDASNDYTTGEETTGCYSLNKRSPMSIEFAR